jgi:hypothetical protein
MQMKFLFMFLLSQANNKKFNKAYNIFHNVSKTLKFVL